LHQIILNLVSNAVEFTSYVSIKVSVKLLKETIEEVGIEFSINDTGIGIEEDKLDLKFENFHQV
jgi:two-component system CheB/CheR fusion protein